MSDQHLSLIPDTPREPGHWDAALGLLVGAAIPLAIYGLGRSSTPALAAYRGLAALIVMVLAVRARRAGTPWLRHSKFLVLAWTLSVAGALSLITSVNPGVSLVALADGVAGVVVLTAACRLSAGTAARIGILELGLLLPVAASAVLEPLGLHILPDYGTFPGRAVVNMGGPCSLGALLATGTPLAVSLWLASRRKWLVAVAAIATVLMFAGITASFSRAAIAAALLGSAATCSLVFRLHAGRPGRTIQRAVGRRAVLLLIAITLTVVGYNGAARRWSPQEYRIGDEPGTQTFQLTRRIPGSELSSKAVRVLCWKTALRTAATRPVLGIGIGCYGHASSPHLPVALLRISARHGTPYRHAYSDYLEILAESGPAALVLFLAFVGWTLLRVFHFVRQPKQGGVDGQPGATEFEPVVLCGIAGGTLAILSQAVVDFPLHLPTHSLILWANLGLLTALSSGEAPYATRPRLGIPLFIAAALLAAGLAAAAIVPSLAEAATLRAVVAHRAGDYRAAADAARAATELAPYEHAYWILLAETLLSVDVANEKNPALVESSLAAYRHALAARPHHAPTYGRIGAIFLSHASTLPGAVDSSRVYVDRSIALNPYQADPHTNLGTLLEMQGQFDEARKEFLAAARLDRQSPVPLFNLGNLEASLGRMPEAIEQYRGALKRDPDHLSSLVNLASLLISVGEYEEASALLSRAEAMSLHAPEIRGVVKGLRAVVEQPESPLRTDASGTSP